MANGYSSQYPLAITGGTVSQNAKYGINNFARQTLYTYTVTSTKGTPQHTLGILSGYSSPPSCPQNTNWIIDVWVKRLWLGSWFPGVNSDWLVGKVCVQQNIAGNEASMSLNSVSFKAKLTAIVNGQSTNADICSGTMDNGQSCSTSVQFDNGRVKAQWTGNLVTGNYPPESKDYVAIWKIGDPYWKVAHSNDYSGGTDSYVQKNADTASAFDDMVRDTNKEYRMAPCAMENAPKSVQDGTIENYAIWRIDCISDYVNNKANPVNDKVNLLLTSTLEIGSGQKYVQDSGNPDTGTAHLEVPIQNQNFVSNPSVLFRVNADWIGIIVPEGKPSIQSATLEGSSFNSGENGIINVVVKNIGDSSDNFVAGLSSCQGINNVYNQGSGTAIDAEATQTIKIYIQSAGGANALDEDCIVQVTAQNSAQSATAPVHIKMKIPVTCDEGKTYYSGSGLIYEECVNGQKVQHQCQYSVVPDGKGGWKCGEAPGGNGSGQTTTTTPSPKIPTSFDILTGSVLLGVIAVGDIGGYYILKNKGFLSHPKTLKGKAEAKTKINVKHCTECGSKQKIDAKFCTSCGAKLK
jgi:hypothetical protein